MVGCDVTIFGFLGGVDRTKLDILEEKRRDFCGLDCYVCVTTHGLSFSTEDEQTKQFTELMYSSTVMPELLQIL